jgi:hypothetical protein
MVLGIFLLAFFIGYVIRAGLRFLARRSFGRAHAVKRVESGPTDVANVDEGLCAWTPLDEVQLNRLLRDSAPK